MNQRQAQDPLRAILAAARRSGAARSSQQYSKKPMLVFMWKRCDMGVKKPRVLQASSRPHFGTLRAGAPTPGCHRESRCSFSAGTRSKRSKVLDELGSPAFNQDGEKGRPRHRYSMLRFHAAHERKAFLRVGHRLTSWQRPFRGHGWRMMSPALQQSRDTHSSS